MKRDKFFASRSAYLGWIFLGSAKLLRNPYRLLFCIWFLVGTIAPRQANAAGLDKGTQIWLQPNAVYDAQGLLKLSGNQAWRKVGTDFWRFFSSKEDQNPALDGLSVIKLSPGFVIGASLSELNMIYEWVKKRNMKLAVGIEMLSPMANGCGRRVEGFSPIIPGYLNKLKRSGISISYFVMDEPLYFGAENISPGACRASLEQTAQNIFDSIKKIKLLFPSAEIGEIEPVPQTKRLASWLQVYHQTIGAYPSIIFADVSWKMASNRDLEEWSKITRDKKIKFGIIYNAQQMPTQEQWADLVVDHIKRIKLDKKIGIDIALFQSWIPQPAFLLPADRPGTMSNVIELYKKQE